MKKVLIIIIGWICLFPLNVNAQTDSFKQYFDKNTGREGFVTINFPGITTTSLQLNSKSQEANTINNLKNMFVIVCDKCDSEKKEEAENMIKNGNYELITTINTVNESIKMYHHPINNSNDKELLMLMFEKNKMDDNLNMVIISLIGDIDLKEISNSVSYNSN